MPTSVSYDGKRLVPAPFISIDKSYYKSATQNLGATYQVSVNGTLVAFKGAPSATGDYTGGGYPADFPTSNEARLANILRQQEILREIFSEDFRLFEVQSANGSAPMKFRPRILSINFPEGIWFDTCPYVVQMEAAELSVFGNYHGNNGSEDRFTVGEGSGTPVYLTSANENWGVEYSEERDIFLVNHSLSVQGRPYYSIDNTYISPLTSARLWLDTKVGPKVSIVNDFVGSGNLSGSFYDYIKSEQVSESEGSVELNESWVLSTKDYTEEYSVNVDDTEEGKSITVEGTIQGLSQRSFTPSGMVYTLTKWSAASGAWSIIQPEVYNRAINLTQLDWVNPTPLSWTVARNQILGTIQYSYNYNNAPPNILDGVRFERIIVNDDRAADVFAIIPILGRSAGPIIQPINTKTEKKRTLTIELALTGLVTNKLTALQNWRDELNKPAWGSITGAVAPQSVRYIEQDQETYDVNSQRYSKVVTWVY